MTSNGQGRVLVLDGFWNKTVAVVRSFGRRGFFVGVGERTRFAPAMFSRHSSRRFLHPSPFGRPERFLSALEGELRAGGYDLLVATEFSTQTFIAEGATIVRSAPVSRINLIGPPPLILALTRTGEPGVNEIFVNPFGEGLGVISGGTEGDVGRGSGMAFER